MIQVRLWKSLYNITMRQAWVLAVSCGYIGNLFLGILTMLISAKTKSAAVAVSMPFVYCDFYSRYSTGDGGRTEHVCQFYAVNAA